MKGIYFDFTVERAVIYVYCRMCFYFTKKEILFFYFYISRCCTALLKALSFIDLKPLGACLAEKQQSDEKLSKSENKENLIMR